MNDVSLVALLSRTLISLAIVLAIIFVAYRVAKRRSSGTRPSAPGRSGAARSGGLFAGRRRTQPAPIEVVGRVGLTRGAAAVAIRFGDKIVLVSATDQGPATVLSEMPGNEWDALTEIPENVTSIEPRRVLTPGDPLLGSTSPSHHTAGQPSVRPSFVEALRQATSRHA